MNKRLALLLVVVFAIGLAITGCSSTMENIQKGLENPTVEATAAVTDAPAAATEAPANAATEPQVDSSKIGGPADATEVEHTAENDAIVDSLAKKIGFTDYVYEAWQLPADAAWEDTLSYYDQQMKDAGWSGDGETQDMDNGGKMGVWFDSNTKTGLLVVFIPSADGTAPAFDLAIFGK